MDIFTKLRHAFVGEEGALGGLEAFHSVGSTVLVALAGGWLGHSLSARRDLVNERRKLRVTYLLEAYRRLEDALHRNDPERSHPKWESAIADIQLLGSPEQVRLARTFALGMAVAHTAPLDALINDLRQSLRIELRLPPAGKPVVYLRFQNGGPQVFDQTLATTAQDVEEAKVEGAAILPPDALRLLERDVQLSQYTGSIVLAWNGLETLLRNRLAPTVTETSKLGSMRLLDLALQQKVITDVQYRSLRGLNAMRNLAVHGQREVGVEQATEFLTLAEAITTVLEITQPGEG